MYQLTSSFKSLIELLDYFKEEKTCYDFLIQTLWDNKPPTCPYCKSEHAYISKSRSPKPSKKDIPEYRCANKYCKKCYTATTATIFHSSKLPLRYWFGAMFLLFVSKKGISSLEVAKQLNVTQRTAWFLMHRIRDMVKQVAPEKLNGIVACDECFIGGANPNRHHDKKRKRAKLFPTDRESRDYNDKTPVVGLVDEKGTVIMVVTPNTQQATLHAVVKQHLEVGSTLLTDDNASYNGLGMYYDHKIVGKKKCGVDSDGVMYTTNAIESTWSVLKRGMTGIYNYVLPKYLQVYCDEFTFRQSHRKDSVPFLIRSAIENSGHRFFTYDKLTKLPTNPQLGMTRINQNEYIHDASYLDSIDPNNLPEEKGSSLFIKGKKDNPKK
jgi:transposase-like protein